MTKTPMRFNYYVNEARPDGTVKPQHLDGPFSTQRKAYVICWQRRRQGIDARVVKVPR
jgi:hypothetical protein